MNNLNFGKGRIIFERARGYIQSVQFLMMLAITIKLYDIPLVWLLTGIVCGVVVIVLFMRFDIKKNMPAEYNWTWEVNPAYQKLLAILEKLLARIEALEKRLR